MECADTGQVVGLHDQVRRHWPVGAIDAVPAARTLLVTFDERLTGAERLAAQIRAMPHEPVHRQAAATVRIGVRYDGQDLAEVAELADLTTGEVVRRHLAGRYVVAFCGFAPGFGYLVGGDPALVVPRRHTPRTRVPAGSVAVAGEFTGIYPREGPGGWQLVGRTDAVLWDLTREHPALLAPGTQVRFEEAGS